MNMPFFKENHQLKSYNTFGFESKAQFWAEFQEDIELIGIIRYCNSQDIPWRILGGGSNVILPNLVKGLLIHPISKKIEQNGTLFVADAGVEWDDFVGTTVEKGYGGLENLSFIPGSVGASPVQNIGAYGSEVKDSIEWVEYLDASSLQIVKISGSECKFGYRDSIFKRELRGNAIVLRVAFRLSNSPVFNIDYGDVKTEVERLGGVTLQNVRSAITSIRASKLPDPKEIGSAGSFFKNPVINLELASELTAKHPDMPNYKGENGVKIPAGWLIDKAGWKGFRDGDAGVHPKQALVLVNYASASANEIIALSDKIIADVLSKYGITLEKEVNIW